jgi:transposase-like protein
MPKTYTNEEKIAALKYVDEHPELEKYEIAKRLKIEKNTLYAWTSKLGRAKILGAVSSSLAAAAAERPSPFVASPAVHSNDPDARIRALEIENAHLRKLVSVYREMAGV